MIIAKKMNAVILAVRDIGKSLAWYKEHFGFESGWLLEKSEMGSVNG